MQPYSDGTMNTYKNRLQHAAHTKKKWRKRGDYAAIQEKKLTEAESSPSQALKIR
jgi:hypothetical protein